MKSHLQLNLKGILRDYRAHGRVHHGGFGIFLALIIGLYLFPQYRIILVVMLIIYAVFFFSGGHHRGRRKTSSRTRHHHSMRKYSSRRDNTRYSQRWETSSASDVITQPPLETVTTAPLTREMTREDSSFNESSTIASQLRYCPRCGAEVEPTDIFCLNCGYKLIN